MVRSGDGIKSELAIKTAPKRNNLRRFRSFPVSYLRNIHIFNLPRDNYLNMLNSRCDTQDVFYRDANANEE